MCHCEESKAPRNDIRCLKHVKLLNFHHKDTKVTKFLSCPALCSLCLCGSNKDDNTRK